VDGKFDSRELIVQAQFDEIVGNETKYTAVPGFVLSAQDKNWLNAYNAPHWMDFFSVHNQRLSAGWENKAGSADGGSATSLMPAGASVGTTPSTTSWLSRCAADSALQHSQN
jgi:hypothetical protein